jgi:hypothetical protein
MGIDPRYQPVAGSARRISLAAAGAIVIALLTTQSRALEPDCPPASEVCVTSLDPGPTSGVFEGIARALNYVTVFLINNWLTICILALIIIFSILLEALIRLLLSRNRVTASSRRSGKLFQRTQGDRVSALLQRIERGADGLDEAVIRIREILDQHGARGSSRELTNGDSYRSSDSPNQDSQWVLTSIARELIRVSGDLAKVRRDVHNVQNLSSASSNRKAGYEKPNTSLRNLEQLVEKQDRQIRQKDIELENLARQIAELSQEIREAKKERISAIALRGQAEDLLQKYSSGLPSFMNTKTDGGHFPTFLEFLSSANATSASHVARLGMMLRVIADAMTRDDSNFELIWSVHEAGKALYALMHVLGHSDVWHYEEATAWARALNSYGEGRFTLFVPVVNSTFSGLEMSGGTPQSTIKEVKSWGVKNRRGDVERKAIVR